jgi:hypothetical protein
MTIGVSTGPMRKLMTPPVGCHLQRVIGDSRRARRFNMDNMDTTSATHRPSPRGNALATRGMDGEKEP